MDFTSARALHTLFSLLNKMARNVIEYNLQHSDFPLALERVEQYVTRRLLVSIILAFSGDTKLDLRAEMGNFLRKQISTPYTNRHRPSTTGDWIPWQSELPSIEIDAHAVTSSDIAVPTMDTVRHEEVLYSWFALRKLPDMYVIGLNFSSATTPELILKTFERYCEYRKTPNGVILATVQIGRWLVVFCGKINLPRLR
ncbi:hypothetical protein M405DRAFT_852979 [Rhizopogon salebrosus TDB-379]|nr:hypothetical protein M405DRAFT_852979 [Rhizopogon salebrosus TDB-379]